MKRIILTISIMAFLASCNNSSNSSDISQPRDPISQDNKESKQNSDFDIMCDCYKNIEESYKELFEMSDEERERNEYKWNKIKGKSRDIDCITANENEMRRLEKENPEIKNWDELLEIWSENCPSAKKAEMMRKKLNSFYENN